MSDPIGAEILTQNQMPNGLSDQVINVDFYDHANDEYVFARTEEILARPVAPAEVRAARSERRKAKAVLAGTAFALGLAACGGDDSATPPTTSLGDIQTIGLNDGFNFEDGTSCGPNVNRAAGKMTYEANKEHIQRYYNQTRQELFNDRPEFAQERVDWMHNLAPWQIAMLGDARNDSDPVATMQAWVERTSVVEGAEVVNSNNWGCKKNADGSWTIFNVPANSPYEAPWAVGTPHVVVDMDDVGGKVEFNDDGSATITAHDGNEVEVPKGEFTPIKGKDGKDYIQVSVFTCDNPQTPEKPGVPVTVTSTPPTMPPMTFETTTSMTTNTTVPETSTSTTTTRPTTTTTRPRNTTTTDRPNNTTTTRPRNENTPSAPDPVEGGGDSGNSNPDNDNDANNNTTTSTTTAPTTSSTAPVNQGGNTTTTAAGECGTCD